MNRPRGGPDPETLARLRTLLDPGGSANGRLVQRSKPPPPPGIEVLYRVEAETGRAAPPLCVTVLTREVEEGVRPGPWAPARVTAATLRLVSNKADHNVLRELIDAPKTTASTRMAVGDAGRFDDPPLASRFVLSRAACAHFLPMVSGTGRLFLHRPTGDIALAWQEEPWIFRLRVAEAPGSPDAAPSPDGLPSWNVTGVLRIGEIEVPLTACDLFLEGAYAAANGRIARVDDGGASSWFGLLSTHTSIRINAARRAAFLEELYSLRVTPPLDLPEGFTLPEVTAPAEPRLLLRPPEGPSAALAGELAFAYEGHVLRGSLPSKVIFDAISMRILRRDIPAETTARARLLELCGDPTKKVPARGVLGGPDVLVPPARLTSVVAALVAEGFRVEAGNRVYRRPKSWRLSIRSGVDWFDLEGQVDFDGFAATLPAVLEALRRGESTIQLDDGTLGLLPEEWLARHGVVLRLGVAREGRVRFSRAQAPLLDALAGRDPRVTSDDAFARAREAMIDGGVAPEAHPGEGFHGDLRSYQREGLGWLRRLEGLGFGGLLADEMGLGKTVQVLAHLVSRRRDHGPALVVAPRSLVFNWKREAARFTPTLRVLDHTGADRRTTVDALATHDLILTTYGTLRRDIALMATLRFDVVVLDEAQAIKNDTSDTARAARQLNANFRLALSGTPVENHLGELWSIVEFLNPGLLGRVAAWKAATERSSPEAGVLLGAALRPFLLRRTKTAVAPDLPARMEETWVCEQEGEERAQYEELRQRFRAELTGKADVDGLGVPQARVLEALLRLRQAACHPGLLDPARRGEGSAKLDALLPELVALRDNGQKALVFSQFRTLLDIVRPKLEAEGVGCVQLDGGTRDREAVVASFKADPACTVLLISLKAGGVGLNLTEAEYVFLLDPWWNPAAEAQAIDRAHRIGQTKPVFAYRLIAKGTVEERIAELQQRKRQLADSVIRGEGAPLRDLSREDLSWLLS